ncbi:unnamed protein product [Caenorhabditis brenneri]
MAADFDIEGFLNNSLNGTNGYYSDGNLELLRDFVETVRRWLLGIAVSCFGMLLIWLVLTPKYLSINRMNLTSWGQIPEFPIINHARYIIKVYFSTVVILNAIIISISAYMMYHFNVVAIILMILCIIPLLVLIIFTYIVTLFGHVYQVMIAIELWKSSKAEIAAGPMTDIQIAQEHTNKRRRIRNLYLLFIARDFLLRPILAFIQISQSTSAAQLVKNVESAINLTIVIMMIFNIIIQILVPFSLIMSFMKSSAGSPNPLQRLISAQAKVITAFQLAALVSCAVVFFMKFMTIQFLPYMFQMSGFALPLIIQITTLMVCRGDAKEGEYKV